MWRLCRGLAGFAVVGMGRRIGCLVAGLRVEVSMGGFCRSRGVERRWGGKGMGIRLGELGQGGGGDLYGSVSYGLEVW